MKNFKQTLEAIAKTPGKPGANPKYESGVLAGVSKYIERFSKINTNTKEGLNEYRELTGEPTKGISDEKVSLTYAQIGEELNERWGDYTEHHIAPITGEIEKKIQVLIGYNFCPEEISSIKNYETPREAVSTAKKIIQTIETNQEAYIKEIISKAPAHMKGVVGRYSDKVCEIDKRSAQNNAFAAIEEYGSKKFVVETYTHAKSAENAIEKEIEIIKEEGEKLGKNMPPSFDSEQKAAYFAGINNRITAVREKGSKLQDTNKLKGTIVGTAIKTLEEKANNP